MPHDLHVGGEKVADVSVCCLSEKLRFVLAQIPQSLRETRELFEAFQLKSDLWQLELVHTNSRVDIQV
jgi:hypothetical protein